MDDVQFSTIEITGLLSDVHVPVGARYANVFNIADRFTPRSEVARWADAAEEAGIRRLLVVVDSVGGRYDVALAMFERLRRFRGEVVAYVKHASSVAPLVALAADYVVLDPESKFWIHSCYNPAGLEAIGRANRELALWLASRTCLPGGARELFELIDSRGYGGSFFSGAAALETGFADGLGNFERARAIASSPDPLPHSRRRAALAGRASPRAGATADAGTLCVEGMSRPVVGQVYPASPDYFHLTSLFNWTKHTLSGDMTAVAFGGASKGFVVVGLASACATSPDGAVWTSRTLPSGDFYGIAYGAAVFCAVGAAGASGACATSSDGVTWTSRTIPAGSYRAICWNGLQFVAVGASGACATSPDGTTWTAQSIVSNSYNGIVWAANPGAFVAVGQSGACSISTDGVHWVSRSLATSDNYQAIAFGDTGAGGVLCAIGANNACCTSSDGGNTWSARTIPPVIGGTRYLWGIAWTGFAFVAVEFTTGVSNAAVYTSLDGATWGASTLAMPTSGSGWRAVVWTGNGAVAVGTNAAATSALVA